MAAAADSRLLTGDLERGCPLLAVAERECNEILAEIAALTEDEADSVEPFFTSLEIYLWHVGAPVLLDAGAFANKFEIILN